jgi:hypothetical protein
VERLTQGDAPVGTATIAYAEMYSGLTRRHRDGDLSAIGYANACEQFERDWTGYLRIRLDEDVLGAARLVIQRHDPSWVRRDPPGLGADTAEPVG